MDVAAEALATVAQLDESIGAFRVVDEDLVRRQAAVLDDDRGVSRNATAEQSRPLRGMVVGVKDVIDTADLPTGYGSPLFADYRPAADAEVVALLRRAGALVLGKTESTEFAMYEPTRTRNPHDLTRTPGGFSSGSAAAVAAGMVPVALGTQTAGSVIRPAAYCGIYGFKPAFSWTSTAGVWQLAEHLDTVGILARSVEDLALAHRAMGRSGPAVAGPTGRRALTVGVLNASEWAPSDDDVYTALRHVADRLSDAGWDVRPIPMPGDWTQLPEQHATVMAVEVAKNLRRSLGPRLAEISTKALAVVEQGDACPAQEYQAALQAGEAARAAVSAVAAELDLVVAPSALGVAPEGLAFTGDPVMCRAFTLLGIPAANVPAYRRADGLPVGVQARGAAFRRRHVPPRFGLAGGRTRRKGSAMNYDFVNVCREELRLCGIHEGDSVAILSADSPDELMGHAGAFLQAAKELGALPYHVRVPAFRGKGSGAWEVGKTPLSGHPAAMAALKEADLVIDLVFMLFSTEQLEIQASGTRILLAVEPIDVLTRLLPAPSYGSGWSSPANCWSRPRACASSTTMGPTPTGWGATRPSPSTATPMNPGAGTIGHQDSCSPAPTTTAWRARWSWLLAPSSTRSNPTLAPRSPCGSKRAGSPTSRASSMPP